jgi:hydrogenase expression/formation protein HypE
MNLNCPNPINNKEHILLGHGSGGRLTHQLINDVFYPAFGNSLLNTEHDGCVFDVSKGRLAVTTDSFVVDPIFFPGGNIGDLAVNGTINDLACCGAIPLYITAGFILEEGFLIEELKVIVESMRRATDNACVKIVTGDTKVVERGKCDKIFINTTGIGIVMENTDISPRNACKGDIIICSGPVGIHGITILSTRESLGFETTLKSDTASLHFMLNELCEEIKDIHVLRDPTRGGLSSTLNEIAKSSNTGIEIFEDKIPVPQQVCAASEILGLDPLYIANEGVVVVVLPGKDAGKALDIMHHYPVGKDAVIIGNVNGSTNSVVQLKTLYGGSRIVNMLHGDQLPRIC